MKEITKKEERLIDDSLLERLRANLPKHYYKDFSKEFTNEYIKTKQAKKVPTRMLVYYFLNGKSENDKILEILIQIVEKRTELKRKLETTIKNAEEQEKKGRSQNE